MKKIILLLTLCTFSGITLSQDITNTLGAGGLFKVKDATTDFLTLNQSNGTITLPLQLAGNQRGSIFKGIDRFIHTYNGTGTYGNNTFLGINAGNFAMGGASPSDGSYNTVVGYQSFSSNTTGSFNSAFGYFSLYLNTTGYSNSAFGDQSLYLNTTGYLNSAFGDLALFSNSTGVGNTALGSGALYNNTTGSNNTAIGNNAQVPSGTSNNQVRIGNTGVTYAGIQVAWTVTSDLRWKKNILPLNLGLDFIAKLNPVSYIRNNDEKGKTEYGLIAQEVEEVLKLEGIENTGMLTITDRGMYELRYNDLIAPMIKAIQELSEENQTLKVKNQNLEERLSNFEKIQSELALQIEKLKSTEKTVKVNFVQVEENNNAKGK